MGSKQAYVQKYKVFINGQEIPDIISIDGLGLGEEGTVEVPEVDRKLEISDGVRTVSAITIRFMKKRGLKTFNFMKDWWDNRGTEYKDVSFALMDKLHQEELHRYFYPSCEITSWTEETQEQGSPKLGAVECILRTNDDVELITL